ncbi:MAG: site-2 protease family protein [Candidatus Obscuribacterales bacterium]|nr:site-2 protease family protein [Candidatus Obscuribacterales bacterium]
MTEVRETTSPTTAAQKGFFTRLRTWFLPLLVVAYTKWQVILLFAMKSAIFAPVITFLFSLASYGAWMGWIAGLGMMVHFLVHELGHYFTSKWLGLRVSLPKFLPFVGAWVTHEDPRSDYKNSLIALGGPTAGFLLSITCLACWYCTGSESHFWLWMATMGFLLNLFNLIPVNPLDGGRVVCKIAPRLVAFAPYVAALCVPVYGDNTLTAITVGTLLMSGLLTNKRLMLTFGAGVAAGAVLHGPLWYLLLAGGFAVMALVDVEYYILLAYKVVLTPWLGKERAAKIMATVQINDKADAAVTSATATSFPLTMPQRLGIGLWYFAMLAAACPVSFWLYKLQGPQLY